MPQQKGSNPVRISLMGSQAYTLPSNTRQILILSGEAWLSLGLNNVVAHSQETVQIHPEQQTVTITPLGRTRLEFMMVA